jgi:hypothetical protein
MRAATPPAEAKRTARPSTLYYLSEATLRETMGQGLVAKVNSAADARIGEISERWMAVLTMSGLAVASLLSRQLQSSVTRRHQPFFRIQLKPMNGSPKAEDFSCQDANIFSKRLAGPYPS